MTTPWVGFAPDSKPSNAQHRLARIFWERHPVWMPLLQTIDDTASHPATWDMLAQLVIASNAKVIVEAGTYRGHGSLAMAEALRSEGQAGHIWTADVQDFGVTDVLQQASLSDYVTFHHGRFEAMLDTITEPIDFAFVDASATDEPNLRLDYLNRLSPRMAPNGIMVVDDATNDGWAGARVLRDTCAVYLPVGCGLAIYQRKP